MIISKKERVLGKITSLEKEFRGLGIIQGKVDVETEHLDECVTYGVSADSVLHSLYHFVKGMECGHNWSMSYYSGEGTVQKCLRCGDVRVPH